MEEYFTKGNIKKAFNSVFNIAVHECNEDAELLQKYTDAVLRELKIVD